MREHAPAMLDLRSAQRAGVASPQRRLQWCDPVDTREQMRTAPLTLRAEALEAQRVIAIGLDDTTVPEARFPTPASLARPACQLVCMSRGC